MANIETAAEILTMDAIRGSLVGPHSVGMKSASNAAQGVTPQVSPAQAGVTLPSLTLPIPTSPQELILSLIAAGQPGVSSLFYIAQTISIPPGATSEIAVETLTGDFMVFFKPFRLTSNYYSSNLYASLIVDNQFEILSDFPLTAEQEPSLPEFGVIHRQILLAVANASSETVEVTYSVQIALTTSDYYTRTIAPFLKYASQAVDRIAQAVSKEV